MTLGDFHNYVLAMDKAREKATEVLAQFLYQRDAEIFTRTTWAKETKGAQKRYRKEAAAVLSELENVCCSACGAVLTGTAFPAVCAECAK